MVRKLGTITTQTLVYAAIAVMLLIVLALFPSKVSEAWVATRAVFGMEDPDHLLEAGSDAYVGGRYGDARSNLKTLVTKFPGYTRVVEAKIKLAMVYTIQGNKDKASKLIDEILVTDNLPAEVKNPLTSQQSEIQKGGDHEWACINYGSAGCIYAIKVPNNAACICRMGVE